MRADLTALLVSLVAGTAAAQQQCQWEPVGDGLDGSVYALASFDDGDGALLYAGGRFIDPATRAVSFIKCWDGTSWQNVGAGVNEEVYALCVYDDGAGPDLYVGGTFSMAGSVYTPAIARWDGAAWSAVGLYFSGDVYALTLCNHGTGPMLYAGGSFSEAISQAQNLACFNGSAWSRVGDWSTILDNPVRALCSGGAGDHSLYVGGSFENIGWTPANRVARWDGTAWHTMGDGFDAHVYSLRAFNDPDAPGVYVGGLFLHSGSLNTPYIARWDGATWNPVGNSEDIESAVNALLVHEQDGVPTLFAGCDFVPHSSFTNPAMWNGQQWANVGSGLPLSTIYALVTHDDGTGPALYAGGDFDTWGGAPSDGVARWRCEDICRPDLNNDGTLNFFDVQTFLQAFSTHDPIADFTDDGQFNFFDVQVFLQSFSDGC